MADIVVEIKGNLDDLGLVYPRGEVETSNQITSNLTLTSGASWAGQALPDATTYAIVSNKGAGAVEVAFAETSGDITGGHVVLEGTQRVIFPLNFSTNTAFWYRDT